MRDGHSPIWSIAPFGAVFVVVSFTAALTPLFSKRKRKDRSRIERYAFDLCGIAAMGESFSCGGGLSFMSFHATIWA
jgi:hypothetical protein